MYLRGEKMEDNESLFSHSIVKKETIKSTLKSVYDSLEQKGYNPLNQLTGYLLNGDIEYISNFQNAREKLEELNRADIIEYLLKESLEK